MNKLEEYEKKIQELMEENQKLRRYAYLDELTGALNRRATEERVSSTMNLGGGFLIGDLDYFKEVNDQYGHLEGDRCLQEVVRTLQQFTDENDIIGRMGGDEFIVFIHRIKTQEEVDELCETIEKAFSFDQEEITTPVQITIGGTLYREGDSYERIYQRADRELTFKKDIKHHRIHAEHAANWKKGFEEILNELGEQVFTDGAMQRNFDSFRNIYRFMERGMSRNARMACVVLITLQIEDLDPENHNEYVDILSRIIRHGLRMGDAFTRYSNHQFLVLLTDVGEPTALMVAERLEKKFYQAVELPEDCEIVKHACYELKPVHVGEKKN